jgi:hypothetical protein
VPRVDDVHQFLPEQIIDSGLNRRLGSHRLGLSKLQGFKAIASKSRIQRHSFFLQDPLHRTVTELFRSDSLTDNANGKVSYMTADSVGVN